MPRATLAALAVYPVKGCRGISLSTAGVAVRGLVTGTSADAAGDREWMVVGCDGRFLTQRENPRLARIEARPVGDTLRLAAPGVAPLAVPVPAAGVAPREVVVWNSCVRARDAGDAAARWLAGVLGADVRLVRFDAAHERRCDPKYAGDSGAHTAFADGYPMLVTAEESLVDLNARLGAAGAPPVPMNRFRPNIVLAGLEPYDEDHVDTISLRGVTLKLVKPCTRCSVTTTDQDSGEVGTEPLATLAAYRHDPAFGGVRFGMNAIVVSGVGGALSVGETVDCTFAFQD
jgi:uncharacterized protein